MIIQHLLLAFFWICYCFIHSFFASTVFKLFVEKRSGKLYRYYRLSYSIFALITLIFLLWYQFSFLSPQLYHSTVINYLSMILVIPGILIMIISIYKYFRLLSGIRSLYVPQPSPQLRIDGIHQYLRHPLYLGTLLFTWGIFFIFPLLNNFIAVAVLSIYIFIGIKLEEKKLVQEFGESYKAYQVQVPMIIPHRHKSGNKKR
ncbi:MAG: isoprenylcysteine carboxylmethyltransferase family protein [Ginsengibacter sp.]